MSYQICPICRTDKHMGKPKLLYGVPICKKCYYKFANRRQLAYIIDAILFQFIAFYIGIGLAVLFFAAQMTQDQVDLFVTILAWTALPMIFFLKDGFAGHSLGKLICGVIVVDRQT